MKKIHHYRLHHLPIEFANAGKPKKKKMTKYFVLE
jgi:hypothetical protein